MIDLTDCTFIIPLRIESSDREFNFDFIIRHLCNNLKTNIIIHENDSTAKVKDLLNKINTNQCSVNYIFEHNDNTTFHRTKMLNEMLSIVKTSVVVNYDIDVFMHPQTYLDAYKKIIEEDYDLVYPYQHGSVRWAAYLLKRTPDLHIYTDIQKSNAMLVPTDCGHCQFFKTDSYRQGFMENENYVSWSPEDQERKYRFITLGYKVCWIDTDVYHIEHSRGVNSCMENPHIFEAAELHKKLIIMNKSELIEYYKNQEYLKKYIN